MPGRPGRRRALSGPFSVRYGQLGATRTELDLRAHPSEPNPRPPAGVQARRRGDQPARLGLPADP
jgi:hypothetical protein